ncbi:MAG: hypothetical protein AAFW89_01245 [Bacteroidota bacterium]
MDEKETHSSKNPASEHTTVKYWLAWNGSNVVGRIAAFELQAEIADKNLARFGWFDVIDDYQAAQGLLETAIQWARERKRDGIHGPLGFSDMDPQGVLVEGYDSLATMATTYNHAYYSDFLMEFGFEPVAEWHEFQLDPSFQLDQDHRTQLEKVKKRFRFEVLEAKKQADYLPHGSDMFRLINENYQELYGFYPLSPKQITYYIDKYLKFVRTDYFKMILRDGKLVGFGIGMPSFSKALQKCGGKLLPFGWVNLLKAFKQDDEIDLYLVSIEKDMASFGLTKLIFLEIYDSLVRNKADVVYTNPIMVGNQGSYGMWFSPTLDKQYASVRKKRQVLKLTL